MNSDVQFAIVQNLQWSELPTNLKQSLGNSQKEYEKHIVSFSINNQLRYRENLVRIVYKNEKKYYEELLTHSQNNFMLYPYHLADVIVKGLRVTPFQYYVTIIESMIENDKSYDSIPNFTAIDCLRLLGIGRNEYIELMNQCRSGKKLFRRKSISKNLLPVKPVDIIIEPWWLVETGFIVDEDIKLVSEEEKELIDYIIDNGMQKAGKFDYKLIQSLYKKGFIHLEVPISDDDHIVVLTLEGFVMNRVTGDYLEKLLYKILVSIDERTSVGELATLLQIDSKSVRNAVSLSCRLNLARKKGISENWHYSWSEIMSSESNVKSETKVKNHIVTDPLLEELSEALAETCQFLKESEKSDVHGYEIMDSPPSLQKRIAFFFDSTLTAFLMMGNLSPDLKKHAVKMFEAGKLTNEDLDEFLNELKNVSSVRDESEGEAKRYFDHALILRETVLALRSNSTKLIDLIRCESLLSLDQEIDRFLMKNYSLLVSMAPLSREVKPIVCTSLPHFGPASLVVNSIWFKLFMYEIVGCGPPSIFFPRGMRIKKLPLLFKNTCDKVLLTSWGHEPVSLPVSNLLFVLNDTLLYTPVLVQSYGNDDEMPNTFMIPFPLKKNFVSECGIDWLRHDGIQKLTQKLGLDHSCGYLTMLRTDNHKSCKSDVISSIQDVSEKVSSDMPVNGVKNEECSVLLQQEVDNVVGSSKESIPSDLSVEKNTNTLKKSCTQRNVTLCIPSSTSQIDDWCILDCVFGVPLFDTKLNFYICNAIVQDGLWLCDSLEKLVQINKKISERLAMFVKTHQGKNRLDNDLPKTDDEIPWPTNVVMFCEGKLSEWNHD